MRKHGVKGMLFLLAPFIFNIPITLHAESVIRVTLKPDLNHRERTQIFIVKGGIEQRFGEVIHKGATLQEPRFAQGKVFLFKNYSPPPPGKEHDLIFPQYNYHQEFWCFQGEGISTLLSEGWHFKLYWSPKGRYLLISTENGQRTATGDRISRNFTSLWDIKDLKRIFEKENKHLVIGWPSISNLVFWSSDDQMVWGFQAADDILLEKAFRIEIPSGHVEVFPIKMDPRVYLEEFAFQPDTGIIVWGTVLEGPEGPRPERTDLWYMDLVSGKTQLLVGGVFYPAEPRWLNLTTVEYSDGPVRKKIKVPLLKKP